MTLRVRLLWSVVLWLLVLPMVLPAQAETSARDVLDRIQQLDQEVGEHWRQARELANHGLLHRPDEKGRILREAQGLQERLRRLEVQARGLPRTEKSEQDQSERDVFLGKLLLIGWALEDLEKAAGAETPPRGKTGQVVSGQRFRATAAPLGSNACADAPVIGYGTVSGTTVGATNDGDGCGSSSFTADVWFRFVAPETRTVSVDTFGSGFDTVLSVRTGCPGTGFTRVCNDDASGLQSAVAFSAVIGTTYWIRVSGFDGATGPFELRVGPGGTLTGTVTRADNGIPVSLGFVRASIADEIFAPSVSGSLGFDGTYTLAGLEAGPYQVRTLNQANLRDEVWDDRPCLGSNLCDVENGDVVEVDSLGTVAGIDFALSTGGAITGTVVQKSTGTPMEGSTIWVRTLPNSEVVNSVRSEADGSYFVPGLAAGSYQVQVVGFAGSDFAGQLYDGVDCVNGCRPEDATPVPVTEGGTTSGIDFQIAKLGVLEGTVTDSTTGLPIEGAFVRTSVKSATTDAAGAFRMTGFDPGTYYLFAQKTGYLTEAFDDTPCPSFCSPSLNGTPVPVDLDQVIIGLDFTLEPFGSISGTVTAADGGAPVTDGFVGLYLGQGRFERNAVVEADGSYRFDNVRAGTYFLRTAVRDETDFLDELYDDIPCYVDCDFTTGTVVTVLPGAEASGVDFALDAGGIFTGTVTDSVTGLALTSGGVSVFTPSGFLLGSTGIAADGSFAVTGLLPGSYLLGAGSAGYSEQLYDRVPCFGGIGNFPYCKRSDATLVEVSAAETVPGLDFALDPLGSISGRITDAVSGAGVSDGTVLAVDFGGEVIDSADLEPDGTYVLDTLPAGSFYLLTSTAGFVDELYDDIVFRGFCSFDCDFSDGTPVAVGVGGAVVGIDFALDPQGEITGTVVDGSTGSPISSARVELFDAEGEEVGFDKFTDASGSYRFSGLAPGPYFVLVSRSGYLPEVYDDILCQGCSPAAKGTPVTVVRGTETSGIDFALEAFQVGLTGTVIATETGLPAEGVAIQIWDSGGNPLMQVLTDDTGVWRAGLSPGTYFASTDTHGFFVDQVYQGVACGVGCDPLLGEPLIVTNFDSTVRGIDFFLETGPAIFFNGFESGDFSAWMGLVP